MKIRRNIAILGTLAILFGCMTLYLMTDLTFPQRKGLLHQEYQDNKWLHFDDRLKRLEDDLNKHNEAVGQIKNAIQQLKPLPPQQIENNIFMQPKNSNNVEIQREECSFTAKEQSATDIQMLEMYKKLDFENIDGGVWKQGFRITYNEQQWSKHHKLKVFIVPHSHNDPGWLKTIEQYFQSRTRNIFNNMLDKLIGKRKFIWAEVSFLSMWWENASLEMKRKLKRLIDGGQLEIVTGGWVMNDEANTHWQNMVLQLTEGHQWLQKHLNVTPRNAWTIDPFGESPTMAYIFERAAFENLIINRVHYSVKKELALHKQLEFRWRQFWDELGKSDMFTHMMPFYSYDIPHTCGPNPEVCCQFDFLRLPGYGVSCPWRYPPKIITAENVANRALMLLDQYRQKSQLYKTNVLLIPLGDDFRYDRKSEWDAQYGNYEKLIEYMNKNKALNVDIQFGTIDDYFNALRSEKLPSEFPSLSGDFFTYADRDDHYWSGYYTSRPFYKRMDRVLLSYVRAADIISVLAANSDKISSAWIFGSESGISDLLLKARQSLSLFQHHDGITGTARDHVVIDYGLKMLKAISYCQRVIQHSVNVLLSKSPTLPKADIQYYDIDDHRSKYNELPYKTILNFTANERSQPKRIVLYNSLTFPRKEIVFFLVSTTSIKVYDQNSNVVPCQISPIFGAEQLSDVTHYEVALVAKIAALSLVTYTITYSDEYKEKTIMSKIKLFNYEGLQPPKIKGFDDVQIHPVGNDFVISNNKITAAFKYNGLLKALKIGSVTHPIHLDFAKYGVTSAQEKSGAYLFLPDGDAEPLPEPTSVIKVIEGPLYSYVNIDLNLVKHSIYLFNTTGSDSLGIEIHNVVNISPAKNVELAMRLSTNINSSDEFFTDLNGYQMIRRKRFNKLPIQANYYPLPLMAYLEDSNMRLTIITAGPLGVSSLRAGQIEIMQDRQLMQDDNRGLGQGVVDNIPTKHVFRIILEKRNNKQCHTTTENHPSGYPTVYAHVASQTLINPLYSLISNNLDVTTSSTYYSEMNSQLGVDVSLAVLRHDVYANSKYENIGMIFHRQYLDMCFSHIDTALFPLSKGMINISSILSENINMQLYETSLTFLKIKRQINIRDSQAICPMELKSYLFQR